MVRFIQVSKIVLLGLLLAACSTTKEFASTVATTPIEREARVVLMPIDVELSLMTASGATEPRAEWTDAAKRYIKQAILEYKDRNNFAVIPSDITLLEADAANSAVELERLHRAVGKAIVTHKYGLLQLPSKKDSFDWTLGGAVKGVAEAYDADHVLFVFVRDSYTSAGRRTLQIFASLVGVAVQTGQTAAFASLVNAETGDVTWFNVLASTGADLRDYEGTEDFVDDLFDTFPLETAEESR